MTIGRGRGRCRRVGHIHRRRHLLEMVKCESCHLFIFLFGVYFDVHVFLCLCVCIDASSSTCGSLDGGINLVSRRESMCFSLLCFNVNWFECTCLFRCRFPVCRVLFISNGVSYVHTYACEGVSVWGLYEVAPFLVFRCCFFFVQFMSF